MNNERMKLGRIQAIVNACEDIIAESKTQMEKINAVILAYERIVKVLEDNNE